jgi:hypothetical protein
MSWAVGGRRRWAREEDAIERARKTPLSARGDAVVLARTTQTKREDSLEDEV